jgi:hypothetical protein
LNGKKITGYESVRLSNASLLTPSDSIDESHKSGKKCFKLNNNT